MNLDRVLMGMTFGVVLFLFSCKNEEQRSSYKRIGVEFSTPHEHLIIEDSIKKTFIPKGHAAIKWVRGTQPEGRFHYVVYVNQNERTEMAHADGLVKRTLLILEEQNGILEEMLNTQDAVECIHCSSLDRDAFLDLIATDTGFQLIFGMNENQYWKEIKTFAYDGQRNFDLIRDQYYIFNNEAAAKQFDTLAVSYKEDLTPKDFGKIKLTNFNIYNEARR